MVRAQRGVNLRGRLTVVSTSRNSPSRTTVNRIVRRADGSALTVCEGPGPGAGSSVEERDGWVKRYEPTSNTVTINRGLPYASDTASIRRRASRILRNYRVTYQGTDECAGRKCYRLQADPRDPMGRPVQVWVDAATGAELWRLESDRQGNTLGLSFFSSVSFPATIRASEVAYRYPRQARRDSVCRTPMLSSLKHVREAAGFEVHAPAFLPLGYEFERGAVVEMSGRRIACLIFGDGMTTLTVSQIRPTPGRPKGYRTCKILDGPLGESITLYGRESLNIQVVGHLDPQALAMVAESIDPAREQTAIRALSLRFAAPPSELMRLRDRGMRLDALAALLSMRQQTGRSLATLARLLAGGDDWRSLAGRLHIPAERVIRQCRTLRVP